jgi:predicted Fe-Mo cluster-binding NifX family protein
MKVVVTANGLGLDAPASPVFGRCSAYVFVDTDTMHFQGTENPAILAPSGAGIQAARFVVERGAQAVVTGNVGPNAFGVFQASGVPVYLFEGGTVYIDDERCTGCDTCVEACPTGEGSSAWPWCHRLRRVRRRRDDAAVRGVGGGGD